jgi:hypothetical protein
MAKRAAARPPEERHYLLDGELEEARGALAHYLRGNGPSPVCEAMRALLLRLERCERIVNEGEQALIRVAQRAA